MFDDIIEKSEEKELEVIEMFCEDCDLASYILSNYPGTKVICQKTGYHMSYKDWCNKWEMRTRVKPH